MAVKTVHLISPGLFKAFHPSEIPVDAVVNSLLQKIVAKSNYLDQISVNPFYNYQACFPLAWFECLANDIVINTDQRVIYAQPMHFELKTDHVIARLIENSDADFSVLLQLLNDFYTDAGLSFIQLASGSICCIFNRHHQVCFSPSYSVLGRDIKHFLPVGMDAPHWNSLFNEIQMLLHEKSSVLQGELSALNALWFWGYSELNESIDWPEFIIGSSSWVKGCCIQNNINNINLEDISELDTDAVTLIDESLIVAASTGDFSSWLKQLEKFNTQILGPLSKQLKNKSIEKILLYDSPASAYELKHSDRFKIFRKTPSIQKICCTKS